MSEAIMSGELTSLRETIVAAMRGLVRGLWPTAPRGAASSADEAVIPVRVEDMPVPVLADFVRAFAVGLAHEDRLPLDVGDRSARRALAQVHDLMSALLAEDVARGPGVRRTFLVAARAAFRPGADGMHAALRGMVDTVDVPSEEVRHGPWRPREVAAACYAAMAVEAYASAPRVEVDVTVQVAADAPVPSAVAVGDEVVSAPAVSIVP